MNLKGKKIIGFKTIEDVEEVLRYLEKRNIVWVCGGEKATKWDGWKKEFKKSQKKGGFCLKIYDTLGINNGEVNWGWKDLKEPIDNQINFDKLISNKNKNSLDKKSEEEKFFINQEKFEINNKKKELFIEILKDVIGGVCSNKTTFYPEKIAEQSMEITEALILKLEKKFPHCL